MLGKKLTLVHDRETGRGPRTVPRVQLRGRWTSTLRTKTRNNKRRSNLGGLGVKQEGKDDK